MGVYVRIGTIKRTVLLRRPWWPVDEQALPPFAWCDQCGAEVYAAGQRRCRKCMQG